MPFVEVLAILLAGFILGVVVGFCIGTRAGI